jgi:hypothetical protein
VTNDFALLMMFCAPFGLSMTSSILINRLAISFPFRRLPFSLRQFL